MKDSTDVGKAAPRVMFPAGCRRQEYAEGDAMTKQTGRWILFLVLGAVVSVYGCSTHADVPRMLADELDSRLSDTDLVVIDVRAGRDWTESEWKIKGAVRADPGRLEYWVGNFPKEKTIVLYCA